ncbi:site-specific integrase [Halobacteriaceae archaeon SHR40]|uniref:tyrosine-type recombinase/integrase n=1 Tax=Halovenus amylolytica TaxID=2500550 RepID=UPI000FE32F70
MTGLEGVKEHYLDDKQINTSENWYRTCKKCCEKFLKFCDENGFDAETNFAGAHITLWENHIKKTEDYSPRTVKNRVDIIRGMLKFGDELEILNVRRGEQSGIESIKFRNIKTKYEEKTDTQIPYVTEDEYSAMLRCIDNPMHDVLIRILWDTGLRPVELVNIKGDEVIPENQSISVDTAKLESTDERTVYPTTSNFYRLQRWRNQKRAAYSSKSESSDYIFLTKQSDQLETDSVNRIIKTYADRAGVQEVAYTQTEEYEHNGEMEEVEREYMKINAKSFRHSFAVRKLKNGASLAVIADMMGHRDTQTVEKYINLLDADMKKQWVRYTDGEISKYN